MKKVLVLLVFLSFLFLNSEVFAQLPDSIDGVEIQSSIDNPRPGQSVDITIESFLFDLGGSSTVWIVDGKTFASGIGIKKITVTAPKIGVPMNISVAIKSSEGKEVRKTLTLRTSGMDIVWEGGGYVPPFFKGKVPFGYQNPMKFIAIPHLSKDGKTELDPKTLIYTWKRDGKYIENGQGYGVSSVEIPGDDLPKDLNITVEVHNRENTMSTSGSITLTPGDPSISFYEDNALYGIMFNRALTNNTELRNREMKVLAVPYSFSNERFNEYLWSINNIEQADLVKNRSITIRTKDDTEGSSRINIDVRNQENILQGATGGFTIYFNKNR
jgi:hypothetical protein